MNNKSENDEVLLSIFKFLGFIILSIYNVYMQGWVIIDYWNWFLLPVFPELKIITFVEAIYVSTFINLFKNVTRDNYNDTFKAKYIDESSKYVYMIITPLVFISIGWLIHIFVK
jgi:hypothetical protein